MREPMYEVPGSRLRELGDAERRVAALETLIAQQLTPLDVAVTHIQILRRKGDDYTVQERDNVAAVIEQHATEARKALFDGLCERRKAALTELTRLAEEFPGGYR